MQRHLLRFRAPPNPRDNFSFVIWFLACFHSTRHPLHPVLLWSRDSHPHKAAKTSWISSKFSFISHPWGHSEFSISTMLTWCWPPGSPHRLSGHTVRNKEHHLKNFSKRCLLLDQRPIELFHPAMRKALHLMHALTFPTIREGRPCSIFSISCNFSGALEFRRRTSSPYSPTCYFRWPCFTWAAERLRISSINCINWWLLQTNMLLDLQENQVPMRYLAATGILWIRNTNGSKLMGFKLHTSGQLSGRNFKMYEICYGMILGEMRLCHVI